MSVRWITSPQSGSQTLTPPTYEIIGKIAGETSDAAARTFARNATPQLVSLGDATVYRQDIQVKPVGYALYDVTVPYAERKKEEGEWTFTFDTTGGTATIKCAKEHIGEYTAPGEDPNPHGGAIGVTDEKVEGVEIVIPALRLSITYSHPLGEITLAQVKALAAYTGYTNAGPFLDFDEGELLFTGVSGSDGTESPVTVTYNFIASANVTGLTFGEITGVSKKGHEYAWVEFKDDESSGQPAKPPRCVYVERVYDAIDFVSLFGWGY